MGHDTLFRGLIGNVLIHSTLVRIFSCLRGHGRPTSVFLSPEVDPPALRPGFLSLIVRPKLFCLQSHECFVTPHRRIGLTRPQNIQVHKIWPSLVVGRLQFLSGTCGTIKPLVSRVEIFDPRCSLVLYLRVLVENEGLLKVVQRQATIHRTLIVVESSAALLSIERPMLVA